MRPFCSASRFLLAVWIAIHSAYSQDHPAPVDGAAAGTLPEVVVFGQKIPSTLQNAPLSETAVTADMIRSADVRVIQDSAKFAPNTFINEFTARKLSNPFFRGIAGSPLNPGVTTYYDGIPILHGNAANLSFLNVGQIELVRGPQSTLFGRNNLGGLILVNSADPADFWTAESITGVGSYSLVDTRTTVSGPLSDTARIAVSGGYESRDGYHVNDVTGHDVDFRSSKFGKVQLLLQPTEDLTLRWTVTGESAQDGDYGLTDLAALRLRPYHVSRDFEGFTDRDLVLTSLDLRYRMGAVDFTSLTGYLNWNTLDATDLDYSLFPGITRRNEEAGDQFTQEFRFASAADAPVELGDSAKLQWQAGMFLFSQDYTQEATNQINPPFGGPFLPFPFASTDTAELEDFGVGLYAHGTLRFADRLDFTAGVRGDFEEKQALLGSYTAPLLAPATRNDLDANFTAVSPTFAAGFDVTQNLRIYGTAAKGYRAGGFNPVSPAGSEAYDEETSWNYEGGLKGQWLGGRVRAGAAFFRTNWDDLQLNVPLLTSPGRYYIANAGQALTKGVELNLQLQPQDHLAAYASFGVSDSEFGDGSMSAGAAIDGHQLPYTPDYTASTGLEMSFPLNRSGLELFGRADLAWIGQYLYDASNAQGQDSYALADFRLGIRQDAWFLEGWVKNAFNEDYIPIALPYGSLAPSGYIGENGSPTTFGLRFGLKF